MATGLTHPTLHQKLMQAQQTRVTTASRSRGTEPPCWRARDELGQDKQKQSFVFLDPVHPLTLQPGGLVPRD